jgi:hypothetical protein
MRMAPDRDGAAQLAALAKVMGADLERLGCALSRHAMWASPGLLSDEDKPPLGVGTHLNLRRGFPSGQHPNDLGWYVAGYLRRRKDHRFDGYVLVTQNPHIQTTSAAWCEAFDVLEHREVLA